jgi:protein involved in polysaccharide export with SLBB domain
MIALLALNPLVLPTAQAQVPEDVRKQPEPEVNAPTVRISNVPRTSDRRATGTEQREEGYELDTLEERPERRSTTQERIPPLPEPDLEFQRFVSSALGYSLPIFGQSLFRNVPSTFAPIDRAPVTPEYVIGPGDELLIRAWGQIDINYRAVVDRNGSIYLPKVGNINVAGVRYDQLNSFLRSAVGRVFKNFDMTVTLGQLRSIQVFVVGQVRRPGSYTISALSTLVNAIFASGGPSKRGSMRHIILKRKGANVVDFDLYDLIARGDKSKDVQLLPGDVIYVPPVGKLVAMAGSVNAPSIFELKDHETMGDLISFAGGLSATAGRQDAILERIDQRFVRRAAKVPLDVTGLATELHDGDVVRILRISLKFDNAVTIRGNVAVPGRFPWREGMRVSDLIPSRDFLVTEEYWKQQNLLALDPTSGSFKPRQENEKRSDKTYDKSQYPESEDNSVVDFSRQDNVRRAPSQDVNTAGTRPGSMDASQRNSERNLERLPRREAQRENEEELKNQIKRSAAEINWEYAVIQRMNTEELTTQLLPFNLGKAIAGDATQNLELKPGDVITIFSQSDMQVPLGQQSKFVRLEGEFRAAGVYQAKPGETLRSLVTRIGGLTPEAYLYGAEFSRESAREDQQRRLDEYINDLEKDIERKAGAQRNLSAEETVAERQSEEGQRRLIEKLRSLKATGRIVLELKPGTTAIADLPDLILEDGDRLLVPFRPAVVNVIGAVYNNNSFVHRPEKNVSDYIKLAGGANRDADAKHEFVIRADGSTVSRQSTEGFFSGGFSTMRLMPGDTVVIPEKLDKGAGVRALKDWTQIISQFVLGAAAVKVLLQQ